MERYGYSYRVAYTAPLTNQYWGKTSYDSDQMRRPVIIDADGGKRISSPTPQNIDSHGNTTETNFQHSQKPLESESRHGLGTYVDSPAEIWRIPTEDSRPKLADLPVLLKKSEVTTIPRSSPEKPTVFNSSRGGYGDQNDFSNRDWQTSPKSTGFNINNGGYGDQNDLSNKDWLQTSPKSSVFNQNQGRYGDRNDFSSKDWQQTPPKSTAFNSSNGGFNEHNGFGNKDWLKPDAHTDRNDSYEDYLRKPTSARPHHVTWGKQAENSLSSPTSDITTAIGYLIEAAKPTVSNTTTATATSIPTALFTTTATRPSIPSSSQYSSSAEPVYAKTTDAKYPENRYGRYNFSSKPYTTQKY